MLPSAFEVTVMLRPFRSLTDEIPGCAHTSAHPVWSPPRQMTFGPFSTAAKNVIGNALPSCAFPAVISPSAARSPIVTSVKPSSRRKRSAANIALSHGATVIAIDVVSGGGSVAVAVGTPAVAVGADTAPGAHEARNGPAVNAAAVPTPRRSTSRLVTIEGPLLQPRPLPRSRGADSRLDIR